MTEPGDDVEGEEDPDGATVGGGKGGSGQGKTEGDDVLTKAEKREERTR